MSSELRTGMSASGLVKPSKSESVEQGSGLFRAA